MPKGDRKITFKQNDENRAFQRDYSQEERKKSENHVDVTKFTWKYFDCAKSLMDV